MSVKRGFTGVAVFMFLLCAGMISIGVAGESDEGVDKERAPVMPPLPVFVQEWIEEGNKGFAFDEVLDLASFPFPTAKLYVMGKDKKAIYVLQILVVLVVLEGGEVSFPTIFNEYSVISMTRIRLEGGDPPAPESWYNRPVIGHLMKLSLSPRKQKL